MLKDFKQFAMRGNVVDMAVGIVIGVAFGAIVASLVADLIMPTVGLFLGGIDFSNLFAVLKDGSAAGPYATLADAKKVGAVTLNYGVFLNALVNFLIVAFAMFLIVRAMNTMKSEAPPAPAEPPPPSAEQVLLTQIRDLLRAGR